MRPAFTPLSAGTRDLNFRRYGVVPFGIFCRPLWVEPFGSYRRIQAPDLSETRPSGLPEAHRAEWRGQGARACPTSPTGLSDATYLAPYCPRSPGAAGRPQCRQPEARPVFRGRKPSGRQPVFDLSM